MAGIGAAIGGFARGYTQGLKLRSDLDDAEASRGLLDLQKQDAQLKIDRENQMKELQTQLFSETKNWQSGQGEYAPQDGSAYDPASDGASQMHYQRIQPLLEQQAVLSGKSPLEVRQALMAMEKDRYAQTTMRAAQLIQTGDASGVDLLKGSYNKMYRDGRTLQGGTYNPDTDTFTLSYVDKDGAAKTHDVKRDALANQYILGALNPADAAKSMLREREQATARDFEAGENDKNRKSRKEISDADNKSAERRTAMTGEYGLRSARISAEGRSEARGEESKMKAINDFEKDLDNGLGISGRSSGIPLSDEERAAVNATRSAGRVAFDSTYDILKTRITGPQFMDVMDGFKKGKALVKDDPKSGFRGVEYNGVRVVVPISSGLFATPKAPAPKQ